ncbi:hypothetical protein Tco_1353569 [Tanacetum coccineum]
MSSNSDDIQAAGSDTRPPMLDRTDYESCQGPFELGTTRNTLGTTPEGGVLLGPERPRTYEDLSDTEKKRYDADVRATNIVLQGLPKDIYKLINHNIEAKAIWDNVKMLLAGSELTKEDRESQLYDEFERFKMLPGENINEYYVRFHKLVNDMRNIRMTMPNIQLNSKFVNNMSPEWDSFVTAWKRISDKRTKNQAKNDKTKHGMEKRGKVKAGILTTSDYFLEEFADELAHITFPPGNDDLPFNAEFDLLELEYLLNHDPIKDMDSILEDSVDKNSLDNNLDDTIFEMFTDEHALDYSSPLLWDDYDDALFDHETVNDDTYDDPFDFKE